MAYFSSEQIADLESGRRDMPSQLLDLQTKYLLHKFKTGEATEHATHGYCRRVSTLVRAVQIVFEQLPPALETIPDRDQVVDATIAIQAFVMNVFGSLDNLAWVLIHERNVTNPDGTALAPNSVSLGNKCLRKTYSKEFANYIKSRDAWFFGMRQFRDSLAHRIPLYIPPFMIARSDREKYADLEKARSQALHARDRSKYKQLGDEQDKLGRFQPWMVHSLTEENPTALFHAQLIADFATVREFGVEVLGELGR